MKHRSFVKSVLFLSFLLALCSASARAQNIIPYQASDSLLIVGTDWFSDPTDSVAVMKIYRIYLKELREMWRGEIVVKDSINFEKGFRLLAGAFIDSVKVVADTLKYFSGGIAYNAFKPGAAPGAGSGEVNTASNLAGGGVGLFKQKTGLDLEFKRLMSLIGFLTVADSTDSVAVSVVWANADGDSIITAINTAVNQTINANRLPTHDLLSGLGTHTSAFVDSARASSVADSAKDVTDGLILNAHVNANAGIVATKLQPTVMVEGENVSLLTNDAGYLTDNQTITLSGAVNGSGTTAITAVYNYSQLADSLMTRINALTTTINAARIANGLTDAQVVNTITLDNITQVTTRPITSLTANNWNVFYSNGSGAITELGIGSSGQVLKSNGTAAAPSWQADATGSGGSATADSAATNHGNEDFDKLFPSSFLELAMDSLSNRTANADLIVSARGAGDIQLKDSTNVTGVLDATIITEGTNAVPNVTDNLSVFAATTSAQLRGVLSDELGTDKFVTATTIDDIVGGTGITVTAGASTILDGNATIALTADGVGPAQIDETANYTWTGQHDFDTAEILSASALRFEGLTDNNIYTIFSFTDPTISNKTITFPDATGTVGLSTNNLSFHAATTSAEFAGVISNESGTGLVILQTSPTIVTPTIASFANAGHSHLNAAGGGTITEAAISDLAHIPSAGDYTNLTGGDGLVNNPIGTLKVNLDFDGGLETVDDSINVKLDGATLAKSAAGLKVSNVSGVTGADEDNVVLLDVQAATTSDFHNIGGTDDDVPEAGDFMNLTAGAALKNNPTGTLSLVTDELVLVTAVGTDTLLIMDATDATIKKALASDLGGGGGEANTLGDMPGTGVGLAGTKSGVQLRVNRMYGTNGITVADSTDSVHVFIAAGAIATDRLTDDPILETELDSEAELETQLVGVTNVFTNNDGALNDDNVTLADVQAATSSDFHNIGGTDDDVPEAGDFAAAADLDLNGQVTDDSHNHTGATISGLGNADIDEIKSTWVDSVGNDGLMTQTQQTTHVSNASAHHTKFVTSDITGLKSNQVDSVGADGLVSHTQYDTVWGEWSAAIDTVQGLTADTTWFKKVAFKGGPTVTIDSIYVESELTGLAITFVESDFAGGNVQTVDTVTSNTSGVNIFYKTETVISHATIEVNHRLGFVRPANASNNMSFTIYYRYTRT